MSVSAGQVEIAVSVGGAEQAIREFERLESTANKLDGRHVKITADAAIRNLNKQIGELERNRYLFKTGFATATKEAKRLNAEIDAIAPALKRAEKHTDMFGLKIDTSKLRHVVKRNWGKVSWEKLAGDAITDRQRQLLKEPTELGKTVNATLKEGNRTFQGRVTSLRNIAGWQKRYNRLLAQQTELELQRDNLPNTDETVFYKTLEQFDTERQGLMALRDSYQAMSKDTDVNNKLAKSLPPVVQKFKDFQSQLKTMDRSSALSSVNSKMEDLQGTLNLIRSKRAELGLPTGSEELDYQHTLASQQLGDYEKLYSTQLRQLTAQEKALMEYDTARKHLETNIVRMGSRMQSLGNGIQRITSPFMNVFRGLTMGVGYQALNSVMQGITGAFSRYDTMKTYSIVLSELGMKTSKKFAIGMGDAKNAIDNLNDAVVGLPTGLDEIVASMRVYAGATGDVEKATKLAIAANNAFIAGGMDARQQLYTQRQLLALAGGEELESQSWSSIRRNAPMAFRAVAEQMKISVKDLSNGLKDGTINGQKFLDVFIKVGTEGRISKAAQRMKQTWDAVSQNIQNAFNRAGEGILKTLDSVFKQSDGRTFLQHVLGIDKNGKDMGDGIKGAIDSISQSAQEWIKNNPEEIIGFFDKLKSIDWAGIIRGFAGFAREFSGLMLTLGKLVGNETAIKLLLRGNMIGRLISVAGALTRGLAGPFSKAMLGGGVFAYIGSAIKSLVKYLPHFKKAATAAPDLMGGTFAIGNVAEAVQKISWASVANKAVNLGGIYVVAKSFGVMAKAMQEFGKVKWSANTIGNLGTATLALGGMTKFITSLGATIGAAVNSPLGKYIIGGTAVAEVVMLGIGKTVEMIGKGLEGLSSGVDAIGKIVTMRLPSAEKVAQVSKYITELAKAFNDNKNPFENLQSSISAWTKGLKAGSIKKIADAMDSIKHLSEIKIKENAFEKAKENFAKIQEFAISLTGLFETEDKKALEATSGDGGGAWTPRDIGMNGFNKGGNTYAEWENKLRGFASQIKSLASSLGYVDTILTTIDTLNKHYVKFGQMKDGTQLKFDWGILYNRISRVSNFIARLVAPEQNGIKSPLMQLKEAADQLKGGQFSQISEAIGQIPKVIRLFDRIQQAMTNSGLFGGEFATPTSLDWGTSLDPMLGLRGANPAAGINFANRLKPIFSALNEIAKLMPDPENFKGMKSVELALGRVKSVIGKLGELSSIDTSGISIEGIEGVATKIKDALAKIEEIGNKEINISVNVDGEIHDNVSSKIEEAQKSIEDAKDAIKDISKKINVKISANMHNSAVSAINAARVNIMRAFNRIPSSLTKTVHIDINKVNNPEGALNDYGVLDPDKYGHSGGMFTHHGVVYKSNGGSIFRPRGIDTVPAMLAPGEYVINRNSARSLGYGLLQKLNHMDVRGALSSLAIRAGQNLTTSSGGGVVNNTTNNTRNANLTLNNYNSGGVGRARATNWIKSLNR